MSTVAFIKGMVAAGFSYEDAIKAAEIMEQTVSVEVAYAAEASPQRSKAAERTARWRAKQAEEASQTVTDRHEPSQNVTCDASSLPLPPSPQTPQPPTPSRDIKPPIVPQTDQPAEQSRRKPKRAIPDGFPTAEAIAEQQSKARSVGANLDVANQAERFRNWAIGNDARYADWAATWRNWCDRAIKNAPKTAVASAQGRVQADSGDDRQRRWLREYRRNGHWPSDDAGPRPEHPACRIQPALLAEFGFAPAAANDPKPDLFVEGEAA